MASSISDRIGETTSASSAADRTAAIFSAAAIKAPARAIATAPVTLSGLQTIDGVALAAGDRVVVAGQANAAHNGVYVVAAGSWTRAKDFNGNNDVVNGTTLVISGGTLEGWWQVSCATSPAVIGTTEIDFAVSANGPAVALAEAAADAAETARDAALGAASDAADDQATVAADKAIVAGDKAIVAADKAIVAADKATVAADKLAAAASASAASGSATLAQSAAASAQALYEQFGEQWLGGQASNPTVDQFGGPVTDGDLYWNTSALEFRVYDAGSTSWIPLSSAGAAALITYTPSGTLTSTNVQGALNELEANKQPLDADLSAIAAIAPSNDDIIQRKAGVWVKRTMAQLWADLQATAKTYFDTIYQPLNAKLTAFAALAAGSGYLKNNGSGTLSWETPETTGATLLETKTITGAHLVTMADIPDGYTDLYLSWDSISTDGTNDTGAEVQYSVNNGSSWSTLMGVGGTDIDSSETMTGSIRMFGGGITGLVTMQCLGTDNLANNNPTNSRTKAGGARVTNLRFRANGSGSASWDGGTAKLWGIK